ncbi:MAG: MerR family transcriptional regulator [Eggerthellaceae bacterium]|nr:MerR family transcriptional regulator [Eggerthellaceae bacterium]
MKIAEVSRRYDVPADTLRYYERAGLLRHVPRNESGIRDYDEAACRTVEFIKCMRGAGVSIETLGEYMELYDQGAETVPARKALLERQRDAIRGRLAELQAALDRLDYKIEHYEDIVLPCETSMLGAEGDAEAAQ